MASGITPTNHLEMVIWHLNVQHVQKQESIFQIHGTQVQNRESLSDQRVNVTDELPNLPTASACYVDGYTQDH